MSDDAFRAECAARLAAAGICAPGEAMSFDARDGRLAVRLAGERMAWFPHDDDARAAMVRERRVLGLVGRYCAFRAPRVIYEDAAGWDVRAIVPGVSAPFEFHDRLKRDDALAQSIGAALGAILADQHTSIPRAELGDWLPRAPSWPRAEDFVHLPETVPDLVLLARIERAIARDSASPEEPVIAHCDVGWHNIAIDPATDEIAGVFDYEGAAFVDRHHDFKYLIMHGEREVLLESVIAVYEATTGVSLDRARIRLLNAHAAIGFLGYRHGHAPDEKWCGRTLAEDIDWTDSALGAAGF